MENEILKGKNVAFGEYKGKPILILNPDDRFPFSFGLSKARLILQHLDDIRAFVEQNDKKTAMDRHD